MSEKKKMSTAKVIALIVSVALHAALIYYLGKMAIDYALPEGEVTSYEMDFSKGSQTHSTEVDVVESKSTPPPPPQQPKAPEPKPVAKADLKPATPPQTLPAKEVSEEPVQDQQGTLPVATEIPEDVHKELMEDSEIAEKVEEAAESTEPPDNPPEVIATNEPPTELPAKTAEAHAEATQEGQGTQTTQAYGTPTGIQSDTVLTPFGTNRPISYPNMARLRKLEGLTIVHYTVSAEGVVTDVKVVESSGHAILDNQAVDTIKGWKFKPTGKVGVYERPIRYSLKGEAKPAPSQLRRKTN